ncbi:carboxymuconolactone decarboxylase family protein [Aromatoleum petrolei]|uniref:Peroxidase n=1 Tax=Aromatoleum petrolei TaxID=76116 RepID=A0ABX1MTE2_9RHOO|nr:peroxidase [Aromatoleum petrolei]NMF91252.1 peroxidase [Aromatoleum petrolei]QTQ38371.1 Uncharacterized protein ToN1_42720 [Aromatoleum petrolei]
MAFIETIAADDAQEEVHAMYERQQASWGYVPNYAKVFSHRPEVLARWGRLLAEIRRPMDARRFELVTFAAAHELRNSACALAHGKALTRFFPAAEVQAMAEGADAPGLSVAERAMIAFSRKVARDATTVTQADIDELRACGLSDAEIFDIVATSAGRAFFTKLLDGLGVLGDSPFNAMEVDLRKALTVGRPLDRRTPETMAVLA